MLKKILLVLAVVVAGLLIAAAMRPSEFRIERKATINAPAAVVFPFANDFNEWSKWNPWDKLDPGMKKTGSPNQAGVGAWYAWQGNDQVGEGKMTIVESKPYEKVVYKLEFIKPFTATNSTTIAMKESGSASEVIWSMEGHNGFMMKLFGMFMDMDAAVGADFEKGLSQLRGLAEAQAKQVPASAPATAPAAK